jgi:hypothetical protein
MERVTLKVYNLLGEKSSRLTMNLKKPGTTPRSGMAATSTPNRWRAEFISIGFAPAVL